MKEKEEITFLEIVRIDNQELIKSIPNWSSKWGIISVCIALLIIVPALSMIEIPQEIKADIVVKGSNDHSGLNGEIIIELDQSYYSLVRLGSTLPVELKSFPSESFGTFAITISKINSFSSSNGTFDVQSSFPNPTRTTMGQVIEVREGMVGQVILSKKHISILNSLME